MIFDSDTFHDLNMGPLIKPIAWQLYVCVWGGRDQMNRGTAAAIEIMTPLASLEETRLIYGSQGCDSGFKAVI